MKAYILLAEGFEEVEAIVPYDILHRARVDVQMVSVTGQPVVTSSHGVPVTASLAIATADLSDGDMIFLPGGSLRLRDSEEALDAVRRYDAAGKWIAAICAAPMILGQMGLLRGRKATCFPGFEQDLLGAEFQRKTVVRDGHIITACGAGAAFAIGREMAAALVGEDTANAVLRQMMFQVYE